MSRTLLGLAWTNVVLHLLGLVLAAVAIRPGTPLVPLDERLDYLAVVPLGWTVAWAVWMLCAVSLIAFLAALTDGQGGLARLGLTIAVTGAGFDLYCDSVFLLAFPMLASLEPRNATLFLTIERLTGIGSLVIANGAYSVAVLLIAYALRDRLGHRGSTLGYAVGMCGLLLAGAGFTGDPWHAAVMTPPTMVLFCAWVVVAARGERPRGST